MQEATFYILGHIYYEIAHTLIGVQKVHIIDTCVVVFLSIVYLLYCSITQIVSQGVDTFLGVDPYTKGSTEVTELLQGQTGVKEWVGANFTVEYDMEKMGDMMIAAIEAKRDALGI